MACLNMSGKISVVKHLFIILHSKGDMMGTFSFMRYTVILFLWCLVFLKLLVKYMHSFSEAWQKSSEEFTHLTGSVL